jgi:hypothetical protein
MDNNQETMNIQWRWLDGAGTEQASISRMNQGYLFEGQVACQLEGQPVTAQYQIHANAGWETQSVQIEVQAGEENRHLNLTIDELQRWWDGDEEIGVLAGCQDVDLEISPMTNTLVINRFEIPIGESRLVTVAWIHFPDLALQPNRQRYTRLGENIYLFENLESGFSSKIEVDSAGWVIKYDEIWEKV